MQIVLGWRMSLSQLHVLLEHTIQLKEFNYFKTISPMKMEVFNEINPTLSF